MSEQDGFKTRKLTSKNGQEYEAGTEGEVVPTRTVKPSASFMAFSVAVNWPVDNTWHNTTEDFATLTGITSYIVGNSNSVVWNYYFQIRTKGEYFYFFTDKTHDVYRLEVFHPSSDHIVRYNSSSPTIINVAGSPVDEE